ncbi:hypothetical protein AGMMS50212_14480 [Spirochaetia bacterium]|nr:hypothetical protein AGMMS50212_14480 [Spirochaetia bacterium]
MPKAAKNKAPELKYNQIESCPIEFLTLDYNNPRYDIGLTQKTDTELDAIQTLCDISDVQELIVSIADNGYLQIEPMVVYKDSSSEFYTVLEGNRRLTAIKLLRDKSIAQAIGKSIPELDTAKMKTMDSISVFRVKSPIEARAYIGFKHINGPQRWDAYAKAKFAASWYKEFRASGKTIEDVARQLGDNNDTVRSYVGSIFVLEQAEKAEVYNIKDRANKGKFAFSHLYTALDRPEYRDFLGLKQGWNKEPNDNPISKKYLTKLQEVFVYIYGSKSDDKPALVKSQNPDLKKLGAVLSNELSLAKVRNGADLETAYMGTLNSSDALLKVLTETNLSLAKAIELLSKIDETTPPILGIVKEIKAQFTILDGYLATKKNKE